MIDSHCHLDHEPLYSNIHDVIKRSKQAGITKILTISTTLESFKKIIELVKKDSIIFGTFGIHPHESESNIVSSKDIVDNVKSNNKIIGVGETGLDFFYNHSDKAKQILSFEKHIEAAIELDVPLIIHSRSAEDKTFEILNSFKNKQPKILMHCFTGTFSFAKKLLQLNSYFSASGIITFKNNNDLQETFANIPNEKLLIETDSPFLAPVPMRGKKNEPSFVKFTAEKLSFIKKINVDKIKSITAENFNRLFLLNDC
jgi:TatD DNase family protein